MKEFLSSQDKFSDYDFDGSNISVLLDLLAWNSHLEAHYLNMVGSEAFLDTARTLDSAYSHAKDLGYAPRSVTSARTRLSFTVDAPASVDTVTVPKFFRFDSRSVDSTGTQETLSFFTTSDVSVQRSQDGLLRASDVEVAEGEVASEVFRVTGTDDRFVVESSNADSSTLTVRVQTSNVDATYTTKARALDVYGLGPDSDVYFLQGAHDGRFELVFGDGNVGAALSPGNLVRVTYLDSSGELGNGTLNFSPFGSVDGYAVVDVSASERSSGGAPRETVESIKFNAPRYFATQGRAVVKTDFENLVLAAFPQVEAVAAYGGEEVVPKQYGRVILSLKPHGDEYASERLKSDVLAFLKGKNVVTEPVVVDPEYMHVSLTVSVSKRSGYGAATSTEVGAAVAAAVVDYFDAEASGFGSAVKFSRLTRAVDDAHADVSSNEIEVRLIKKTYPTAGVSQGVSFSFYNALESRNRVADTTSQDPIVSSSRFTYRKNSVDYDAAVQDDGAGTLFVSTEGPSGRVVLEASVGTVDYDTGEVSLTLNPFSYGNSIDFTALPEHRDVSVSANYYLTLDEDSLDVTVLDA